MDIKELDSFRLSDAISFHENLNPKLWRGNKLIPLVKEQLLTIAQDFLEELGVNELDVRDITISGSNAAYTYTKHSDLDLHILVNLDDLPQSDVYKELFNAKKNIYNDTHDITVHGVPVELYVQDAKQPVKSLGEYSIKNDKWLRIPTKRRANFDQNATKAKYEKLLELVKTALKTKDAGKLSKILGKIKQYRQAGLDKKGEFGPENLAYKALRSQGYITKLYSLRDKLHSERLSIEGMYAQEDYHPNAKPRGPEFKPTMPKGTVRVDVSDVYDWYKLGQHISNMKGLGKHDFGKGPPSTILSFGDEDTEHQYIQDLEKTGLSTTDIDPVDPKQPKGMKRQKVDPTFNVNESEFNKCFDKACKLYDKAVDKGLEPILYQVADYKGDGSNADNRWAKLPQHVWSHYVTVIGDIVFDPTAKQFGDDKQEKYSIDKLKSEWNKIYKIRPQETNEALEDWRPYQGLRKAKNEPGVNLFPGKDIVGQRVYHCTNSLKSIQKTGGLKPKADETGAREYGRLSTNEHPFIPVVGVWFSVGKPDWFGKYCLSFVIEPTDKVYVAYANSKGDLTPNVVLNAIPWDRLTLEEREDTDVKESTSGYTLSNTKEYNGILMSIVEGEDGFKLTAKTPKGIKLGFVEFSYDTDGTIRAEELEVYEKHRGKGIAKAMYDYVKSQGFTIARSSEQTPDGAAFWNKHKPGERVWEQSVSESASGYIPSNAEKDDPRFKTALTVDIKPDTMKKDAKKLGWNISRAGIPPLLRK